MVTIRDVAKLAGVSESTVSRVLSGSELAIRISDATRQRVLRVAEEMSYRPNPSARALRGKRTNLLGLIVREIDDPFFAQLIEVVSSVAKQKGYDLILGYAKSDVEEALILSDALDPRYCDGLLLLGELGNTRDYHSYLAKIGRAHRLVTLCSGSQERPGPSPSIRVDNRKGTLMALEYLASLGHRQIAFVDGSRLGDLGERRETYCEFMGERFGGVPDGYVQSGSNSYEGGYQATEGLLSLDSPPTAVLAADDTLAVGVLRAASEMGHEVPRDLSVVGFDDVKIAAYLQPALTTVRQPVEDMGKKAVELLLQLLTEDSVPETIPYLLLEPQLIVRDSCAPPAKLGQKI